MKRAATVPAVAGVLALAMSVAVAAEPNDPGSAQQWGLRTIRAYDAWNASRGAGVVVAVIDTGVDARHPDLAGRVLPGRDFVDDDDDASDAKGHGTHVTGTIAANAGNGVGIASVAPGAKILPVRVLGPDGEGDPGDVADGVRWAVDHGARVINLSLAQDDELPLAGDTLLRDTRVDQAIKDAAQAGAAVIVAAGNNDEGGTGRTAYDSDTAGVLVVGATTGADRRAAYSNFGEGLDVVAPGGGSDTDAKVCSDPNWIVSTWWNPQTKTSDYGGGCGTSMAVAHVSGIAALLMARGYSGSGAAARIVSTAKDLDAKGWDSQTGHGRVDARAAVGPAPVPSRGPATPRPSASAAGGGGVNVAGSSSAVPSPTPDVSGTETASPNAAPGGSPTGGKSRPRSGPVLVAALLAVGVAAAHRRFSL